MDKLYIGKQTKQENGTRETNGPPKSKFSVDEKTDAEYSEYSGDIELRGEPRNMPRSSREWSVFNRKFADFTMGMKQGEKRKILIYTDRYIYSVAADGYMTGYADEKVQISEKNRNRINEMWRRMDEINENRGSIASWIDAVRAQKRNRWNNLRSVGEGRRTDGNDRLFGGESRGDGTGYSSGIMEDSEDLELLPGTMVFDGENAWQNDQDGNAVKIDFSPEESVEDQYGLKLPTLDENADGGRKQKFSVDDTDNQATIGELQVELYVCIFF